VLSQTTAERCPLEGISGLKDGTSALAGELAIGMLPTEVTFQWSVTGASFLAGSNPVTTQAPTVPYVASPISHFQPLVVQPS
jgi:hypothetical protein